MASVRVRKDTGLLFLDFKYQDVRCREQTLLNDTPKNRSRLQKLADRIEGEIQQGTFDYAGYFPTSKKAARFARQQDQAQQLDNELSGEVGVVVSTPTFSEFVETWWSENEVRWRQSTRATNHSTVTNYLLPEFGEERLTDITRERVLAFRTELTKRPGKAGKKSLHPTTINYVTLILGQIMAEAADRFDFKNPCGRIKKLSVPKKDIQPFSLQEVQLILNHVREDYRCYFTIRFLTGMRTGEIHGLRWKHIDFDRKQILIRETFSHGRVEYTKNDSSQREIDMAGVVYDALTGFASQIEASSNPDAYVFASAADTPLDTKNVTDRVWYPLLRYLNLEKRRPYQTRHTAATLWLAAGESPEWIARQMGHSSTEMLFKVYSRYVPNLTRQDGSAFEAVLNQAFRAVPGDELPPAGNGAVQAAQESELPPAGRAVPGNDMLPAGSGAVQAAQESELPPAGQPVAEDQQPVATGQSLAVPDAGDLTDCCQADRAAPGSMPSADRAVPGNNMPPAENGADQMAATDQTPSTNTSNNSPSPQSDK